MQGADGGWGSFDADNNRLYLNHIPFADHGALLDPSTEDLTGRGLELLGTLGYQKDFEPARRAIDFLRHAQRHDGPWHGRWGVNYIYGTWSVLRGARRHRRGLRVTSSSSARSAGSSAIRIGTAAGARPARATRTTSSPAWATRFRVRPRGRSSASSRPAARVVRPSSAASTTFADAARRRLLGRRALERHGLSAGLLLEVPPVRPVFSALGAGNLPPRACLSARSHRRCALSTRSAAGLSRSSIRSVDSASSSRRPSSPSSRRRSSCGRSSTASTSSATTRC